ncbi:MAG TPA: dihydrofolate reductase family protein [Pseudonocardia sp.]|nr:dihydrofolate reductase family protein [Pseudonocardia sp.]
MGKIVVSENVTLDGVVQDPTGEQGFTRGGWFDEISDADREAWATTEYEEAMRAEAVLLGRKSDDFFGRRWNGRRGPWADRLNRLPKYVVSTTLVDPVWSNSTVLVGNVVSEVSRLKREIDGDILVYASRQLVHTMIEHDLVDELRLMIYPVVLGAGERLFGETGGRKAVRLLSSRTVGEGLAYLTFELNGNRGAPSGLPPGQSSLPVLRT